MKNMVESAEFREKCGAYAKELSAHLGLQKGIEVTEDQKAKMIGMVLCGIGALRCVNVPVDMAIGLTLELVAFTYGGTVKRTSLADELSPTVLH